MEGYAGTEISRGGGRGRARISNATGRGEGGWREALIEKGSNAQKAKKEFPIMG